MNELAAWLKRSDDMNQNRVAQALGTTRQAVQSWCCGRVKPGLYYALALERLSHGEVGLDAWLTADEKLMLRGLLKNEVDSGEDGA